MAAAEQHKAALAEPIQYPGRMETYPGQVKGQAPVFVHDCVPGCPMQPARPRFPMEGNSGPQDSKGVSTAIGAFGPSHPGNIQFPGQQAPRPAPPGPGLPVLPIIAHCPMVLGPNGEQIFFHPHYPQLRADLCKTCRHVIPIRPPKFAKKLTKQELGEFQECFQMFDKDGDGTIDTKELGAVMRSLGQYPDEEEIEEMVDDADEDGSGSINFQEFVGLMLKKQQGGQTREEIKQAFRVFDKDGSGYVSSSELKMVMSKLGVNFTDDELNEMVLEADIDGDGQVCFEEFYNMMTAS